MSEKDISMENYQWSHFGAIIADVIVLGVIAYFSFKSKQIIISSDSNIIRKKALVFNLNLIFWLSIVVAFITLLGLVPIFMKYSKITIS